MKHDHMPALNKYTSPNQYAALQEIDKTGSLITLLTQGKMGTTLGALIRNAWIDSETITDAEGVTSERWHVTDAGRHSMKMYEVKQEQERKAAEARAEIDRIRREQEEQKVKLEKEMLESMTEYYLRKNEMQTELNTIWEGVMSIARAAHMDRVKFDRCKQLAKARTDTDSTHKDPW
jgi:hypothetical protein